MAAGGSGPGVRPLRPSSLPPVLSGRLRTVSVRSSSFDRVGNRGPEVEGGPLAQGHAAYLRRGLTESRLPSDGLPPGSATAATAPPAAPAGEGGPPAPPPNLTSNRRLQQTQAQVDEVVDIMRVNVDKVLERDQKLSELDDRADALQAGASQFETSAAKLKRKYWWKNLKMMIILGVICAIILIIIIVYFSS
ncbi:vesicle-associated membrane protein 2 isoform X1 [Manis javanica]|uniref:vesicle-associated membrane protein 2 isoform X1 n=1 Tax=Manis javanica TaxID=9974 RepID=UPI00187AFDF7|nr:vesicle-associated membrane protein 2 isoform X1 [Manis javanica]